MSTERNKMRWTDKDLAFLRDNYAMMPLERMSRKLKRGIEGIKSAASIHGITRPKKKGLLFHMTGKPRYRVLANGCWQWIAGRNRKGYPIAKGTHTTLAYREIYIRKFGPIPQGMTLDHTCKNRACVNIEHLELVPHIVNVRRSKRTLLSPEMVAAIRADRTKTTGELARELNVTYNAVYFARRGDSWKTL